MDYTNIANKTISSLRDKNRKRKGLYFDYGRAVSSIKKNGNLGYYLKRSGISNAPIGKAGDVTSGYVLAKTWAVIQNCDPLNLIQEQNMSIGVDNDMLLILCIKLDPIKQHVPMGIGDLVKFNNKVYEVVSSELAAVGEFFQLYAKYLNSSFKLKPENKDLEKSFVNFVE